MIFPWLVFMNTVQCHCSDGVLGQLPRRSGVGVQQASILHSLREINFTVFVDFTESLIINSSKLIVTMMV